MSGSTSATLLSRSMSTTVIKGATKAVTDAFGEKGYQEKWFEGYDWVIRLNADVLLMDDTWLRKTMENASIDGIFGACMGDQIHTDFFALRPQAVDYKLVDECSNKYGAEKHFTCAIANLLRSKRFTWVPRKFFGKVFLSHTCEL